MVVAAKCNGRRSCNGKTAGEDRCASDPRHRARTHAERVAVWHGSLLWDFYLADVPHLNARGSPPALPGAGYSRPRSVCAYNYGFTRGEDEHPELADEGWC